MGSVVLQQMAKFCEELIAQTSQIRLFQVIDIGATSWWTANVTL
jgi:hypothetical protein